MNLKSDMHAIGKNARAASATLSTADTHHKNNALIAIAEAVSRNRNQIETENQKDIEAAEGKHLDPALVDRLMLNDARIDAILESLTQVASLDDPIGSMEGLKYRPSGIQVGKMRVPIGVIGIIYESRPNVTLEASSLCIKSGNAAILRGGSESFHSNQALANCVQMGLEKAKLPPRSIQMLNTTDRAAVGHMITMDKYIDVIIPRGGKQLIERISREASVPVIKHLDGVCHIYIDSDANAEQATNITVNAKTQRYGTCNTLESLLINKSMCELILPLIFEQLAKHQVEVRACKHSISIAQSTPQLSVAAATDEDWAAEYLAPILSVKVVEDMQQAIDHINTFGSGHTDAILTQNHQNAMYFLRAVDSSSVIINASTRFADGFEYGLGAEIGISTNKLHARGPVGLEGLTTQKYVVLGNGQVRQ